MPTYDAATLERAHEASSNHREAVGAAETCGCFYCRGTFRPGEIVEWIDGGDTALCPRCGIDSVLADGGEWPVTDPAFLRAMHSYWFETVYTAEEAAQLDAAEARAREEKGRALTPEERAALRPMRDRGT